MTLEHALSWDGAIRFGGTSAWDRQRFTSPLLIKLPLKLQRSYRPSVDDSRITTQQSCTVVIALARPHQGNLPVHANTHHELRARLDRLA